jgi:hypothetical protein
MLLIHDLLWAIGLALMIISTGYTARLYNEMEDKNKFKFPLDATCIFIAGVIMYIISFYIPIPIIR